MVLQYRTRYGATKNSQQLSQTRLLVGEGQKGDAKKGTGRKTSENVMSHDKSVPFPIQPHFVRGPPAPPINVLWSTEKRETG